MGSTSAGKATLASSRFCSSAAAVRLLAKPFALQDLWQAVWETMYGGAWLFAGSGNGFSMVLSQSLICHPPNDWAGLLLSAAKPLRQPKGYPFEQRSIMTIVGLDPIVGADLG